MPASEPISTTSMGPSFNSMRVGTEVFSGAAHRAQAAGFSAAHGDLKNRTSRRIVGIQEVFRLGKKRGPEKFNRFAHLLVRQLFQEEPSRTATTRRFHLCLCEWPRGKRPHRLKQERGTSNRIKTYCYNE